MTGTKLAVNVFEESKTPEQSTPAPPQQNQQPADPTETKTQETKQQENTTRTQIAQDDNAIAQNTLSTAIPWIGAGIVAITILLALLTIIRRTNRENKP